jgi:acyl CoA:acetate/3-ketoacid CoA transferase alpha subunit
MAVSSAILAGGSVLGGIVQGKMAGDAQKKAQAQALAASQAAQRQSDEAMNRANMVKPDVAAISNQNGIKQGNTMLTGAGGAQLGASSLGKNTLLGS